jgi:predicted nucleic acid-binding protein
MKEVLLDTTAYIAFRRGNPAVRPILEEAGVVCVSPISVGELLAGFRKGVRFDENVGVLREFLREPRVRVLEISLDTADRYAAIQDSLRIAGTPIPSNDIWLAATAMQHGCPLLTGDAHFRKVRQILVEWFDVSAIEKKSPES